MSAIGVSPVRPTWWAEVRKMMKDAGTAGPSSNVIKTLIICATIIILALFIIVGWLAYAQRDATTIVAILNLLISSFILKQIYNVDGRVRGVENQTNGNTSRLMDAALKDRPQQPPSE